MYPSIIIILLVGAGIALSCAKTVHAQAHTEKFSLFFIALNDAGKHGAFVGCGDSVVPVDLPASTSSDKQVLRSVVESLLGIKTRTYGSGLYNALYQSELKLKRALIKDNRAIVDLTGELKLAGECDGPRVEAQLRKTALQFSHVVDVTITLNGVPLAHALSPKPPAARGFTP